MKLEVGKTYLDGYDRKIKIIGNDCGIFYGKLLGTSKFFMEPGDIDQFYSDGSQHVKISAGSRKNKNDLVKEFKRDPIVVECSTDVCAAHDGTASIINESLTPLIGKTVKITVIEIIED